MQPYTSFCGCRFIGWRKRPHGDNRTQRGTEEYADGVGDLNNVLGQDTDDDISKFMGNIKLYPVLKFPLRGRIL